MSKETIAVPAKPKRQRPLFSPKIKKETYDPLNDNNPITVQVLDLFRISCYGKMKPSIVMALR
jgi:Na+-transporting NADH:ubiquinone oxidoreductase subunit D